MELKDIDIKTLIPQQPPFIMIDTLLHFDQHITMTEFEVRPDNIFVEEGKLLESGMVENIAQTCAARLGYINTVILKDKVRIGFIGAVKLLKVFKQPEVYAKIVTTVELVNEVFNISLVNASISCEGEVLATCEMKISIV